MMHMVIAMIRDAYGRDHDRIMVCKKGIVVVIDAYGKDHDRDRKGGMQMALAMIKRCIW